MSQVFWTPQTAGVIPDAYANAYAPIRVAGPALDGSQDTFAQLPVNTIVQQAQAGNAATTSKLKTARNLAVGGAIAFTLPAFDGSADASATATIQPQAVANSHMAAMAPGTLKGASVAGSPVDLSASQAKTILSLDQVANASPGTILGGMQASHVTNALGYAPVERGTGPGQLTNRVQIGWNSSDLLLAVDGGSVGTMVTWKGDAQVIGLGGYVDQPNNDSGTRSSTASAYGYSGEGIPAGLIGAMYAHRMHRASRINTAINSIGFVNKNSSGVVQTNGVYAMDAIHAYVGGTSHNATVEVSSNVLILDQLSPNSICPNHTVYNARAFSYVDGTVKAGVGNTVLFAFAGAVQAASNVNNIGLAGGELDVGTENLNPTGLTRCGWNLNSIGQGKGLSPWYDAAIIATAGPQLMGAGQQSGKAGWRCIIAASMVYGDQLQGFQEPISFDGTFIGAYGTTTGIKFPIAYGIDLRGISSFSGGVLVTNNMTLTDGGIALTITNAGIELGSLTTANNPFTDYHSSGFANDYDVRTGASGGVNGTSGQGNYGISAARLITPDQVQLGTVGPVLYRDGARWGFGLTNTSAYAHFYAPADVAVAMFQSAQNTTTVFWKNNVSTAASLSQGSDGTFSVNVANAANFVVSNSGGTRFVVQSDGTIRPGTDNAQTLGNASYRLAQVYAVAGTINTSDGTEKDWIGTLSADELAVGREIAGLIGTYQWKAAVAAKGDAIARIHAGVIAQEIAAAFERHGLNPARYGIYCVDELDDGTSRYGLRLDELQMFVVASLDAGLRAVELKLAA